MPSVEKRISIDLPPENVFRAIADVRRSPEWISAIVDVKDLSADVPQIGSTFVEVASFMGKRLETPKVVTVYDAEQYRFAHKSTSGPVQQELVMTVEPADGASSLIVYFEAEPGGFFGKLPMNILVVALDVMINGNMQKLKKMLEEGAW